METANVTFLDSCGNTKVEIDHEKCIVCGRCIWACRHNARYYTDDTERFFNDLSKGVPVSLMAAPSILTNFPEYKRLFTYLKKLGVNKIYDVSLGAAVNEQLEKAAAAFKEFNFDGAAGCLNAVINTFESPVL